LLSIHTAPSLHLVLDLDGTLLLEDDGGSWMPRPRPHLREFLSAAFAYCASVSLWTAASAEWLAQAEEHLRASGILTADQQFLLRWSRSRCRVVVDKARLLSDGGDSYTQRVALKPLSKCWRQGVGRAAGMRRSNTVVVDDLPASWSHNYGNALRVQPYTKVDPADDELRLLALFLPRLVHAAGQGDVRALEKRGWQMQMRSGQAAHGADADAAKDSS